MTWWLKGKYAKKRYYNKMRSMQYHLLRQIGVSRESSCRVRAFRPNYFFLCFQRALNGKQDHIIQFEVNKLS